MLMCLTYVCADPDGSARRNFYLTEICRDTDSQLVSCDNCGGDGGFYHPETEQSLEAFSCCPECGGSGWIPGDPPSLTLSDLEERAP